MLTIRIYSWSVRSAHIYSVPKQVVGVLPLDANREQLGVSVPQAVNYLVEHRPRARRITEIELCALVDAKSRHFHDRRKRLSMRVIRNTVVRPRVEKLKNLAD